MANYKVFNVRRRHEWLAEPLKKKRIKRRSARRVGLLAAWERKGLLPTPPVEDATAGEADATDDSAAAEQS